MNINVENNTNIVGGVVANVVNAKIPSSLEGLGEGLYDGGNLSINTKTLTYSDFNNYNNSETNSFGINVALPVGFGSQVSEGANGKTKVEWGKSLKGKSNLAYTIST